MKKKRPEGIEDEHLEFLDDLRESGITNMFGARAYIEREFDVDSKESRKILLYWMDTFGDQSR
jgi:hypothetical protein